MAKKITDININFAENGVIVRVSKEDSDEKSENRYDSETMVFKSMGDASEWLAGNAPDLKKKWEGKISEAITNN